MNCSVFNFEVSDLRVCADGSVVPHSCGGLAGPRVTDRRTNRLWHQLVPPPWQRGIKICSRNLISIKNLFKTPKRLLLACD